MDFKLFKELLKLLNRRLTWQVAVVFLLFLINRERLAKLWDKVLDRLGELVGGEWSYWRFDPKYREQVRAEHLHLKLVGIRTEEERQPQITQAYVPIKLVARGGSIENAATLDALLPATPNLLILGDPGAGKSTILAHLVTEFTRLPPSSASMFRWLYLFLATRVSRAHPLPIYVPLRRCLSRNRTLLDDISDPDTRILSGAARHRMPRNFIERATSRGRAVMLLDGLDEVAGEAAYKDVIRKVNEFKQIYSKTSIVVTCRKAGWRGELHPDFQIVSTLPLDSQQQYEFIHKWYAAILEYSTFGTPRTRSELERRAEKEADRLVTLIRTKERLREVASNPLILSLICLVHRQKRDLPRGRTALYENCVEILLDLWDRIDKDLDQAFPSTEEKKLLLRRVAYRMHTAGLREVTRENLEAMVLEFLPKAGQREAAADIVRQIEVRSGLIVERSIDVLMFSHLTFQEYFVVEYLQSERKVILDVGAIEDWSAWREPLLLLCGVTRDPAFLLKQIAKGHPLIALSGIPEVDPVRLDIGALRAIVADTIDQVRAGAIGDREAIPPLVGLLSTEGDPFRSDVVTFIDEFLVKCSDSEVSEIIESLSKIPTPEAARLMLSLIPPIAKRGLGTVLFAGLGRIGDPAVYECLDAVSRGTLSEQDLFHLLVLSESPGATRALWEQYHLEPPREHEREWAMTWAVRLTSKEQQSPLRGITVQQAATTKDVWPYRYPDFSAEAAIVCKCVAILQAGFKSIWEMFENIEWLSRCSLRVAIPLLVRFSPYRSLVQERRSLCELAVKWGLQGADDDEKAEAALLRILAALGLESSPVVPIEFSERDVPGHRPWSRIDRSFFFYIFYFFRAHQWSTLRGFLGRTRRSALATAFRKTCGVIGVSLGIACCVLVTLGIRTWLPPDGTYAGFWLWTPLWGRVSFPILVAAGAVALALWTEEGHALWMIPLSVALTCALPAMWLFVPFIAGGTEVMERMVSSRKVAWSWLIYAVGANLLCGWLGIVGIRSLWPAAPFAAGLVSIGLIGFLGLYVALRASAFEYNEIATWLERHPRGREVLDEFRGQEGETA